MPTRDRAYIGAIFTRPGFALPASVLVVDDDKRFSEVLEVLLNAEGYNVSSAHDGAEGLRLMRKMSPDVVILDIQMPIMDGIEVLSRMRAHPYLSRTPVILASGEREVTGIARRFSNTYALRKPFDLIQLTKLVSTVTENQRIKTEVPTAAAVAF